MLPSIEMGSPGPASLQKRIDLFSRCVISRCVIVQAGAVRLMQKGVGVLIRALL